MHPSVVSQGQTHTRHPSVKRPPPPTGGFLDHDECNLTRPQITDLALRGGHGPSAGCFCPWCGWDAEDHPVAAVKTGPEAAIEAAKHRPLSSDVPLFRSRGSGHEDESAVLFLRRFDDFLRLTQLHHSQYYWAFTVALSKLENTTDVATWVEWLREFSKSDTPWNVVSERFKQHFSNPSERFDILDKIENCRQRGRDTQVYTAEYISYFTQLGQPPSMADLLRLIRGFDKWVISALDRHRESMRRSTSDLNWDFEDFTTIQQVANSAVNTNRIASSGDGGGGGGARGAGVRGGRGGRRGGGSRRSNNNNNNNNSSANNVDSSNRSKSSRQRCDTGFAGDSASDGQRLLHS